MLLISWLLPKILGIVFVILAGIYIYYKYYIFNFWRKLKVFYLEPTVPAGNITPLITSKVSLPDFYEYIYRRYKEHRLIGTYTFYKPNLIVTDPDIIREILVKEFSSFHDRGMFCNEKIDPLSGHLFLLSGKKWRNARVKLTPTFTSGKIKQMFQTLKETGDALSQLLDTKAKAKETIEIKDILARYSTDIIMSTAFGVNCNSLENPNNDFRYYGKKVFEAKPVRNALLLFAPKIFDILSMPYTDRDVTNFFMRTFKENVEYRENNNIVRKDFLNLLIQLMKNGFVDVDEGDKEAEDSKAAQNKLTMTEATAQSFLFYLAGFETSSTTATYCLYELSINQDIQDKVREEIRTIREKHGITYNSILDMKYLHKVVSETMRKYPAVAVLNRVCTKDVELPGTDVRIPEGTLLTIPVIGLHRDASIYPDPEKFDPERFSDENVAARHPYAYLPFGEGPRICIGLRFGLIQTKIAIISALTSCRYKLAPSTPYPMKFDMGTIVTTPKGGVHLNVESI